MVLTNRWNRLRYRWYAPIYDVVASPLEAGRKQAIERLDPDPDSNILIVGCGTGMDLPYLPASASVTAIDLIPTMVRRTRKREAARSGNVATVIGDAHTLPFPDDSFDVVLLHLVLSVVPDPGTVVGETDRVLRSDGRVSLYDKFSPEAGDPALVRRLANPVARLLFADLNRDLEPMLAGTSLTTGEREHVLGGLYTITIAEPTNDD